MLPEGATDRSFLYRRRGGRSEIGLPHPQAMKDHIIYKEDLASGEVIRSKGRVHAATRELEDFDRRMLRTLHHLECRDGSRFRIPNMPYKTLQKVWGRL